MSLALPLSPSPTPALPASRWISLATAVERSGRSAGHLRRQCGEHWMAEGLARLERDPQTNQQTWHVREDADPAFALVKSPEQLDAGVDLRQLSDAHRQQVLHRKTILDGWANAQAAGMELNLTKDASTARYLQRIAAEGQQGISRRTLYLWRTSYRRDGLSGLVDDRRERQPSTIANQLDPFFSFFSSIFLTQKQPKIALCHAIAEQKAVEMGWEVRSYKLCQRFVKSLDPALVTKKRQGEKAFVDKHEPNLRRDYSTIDSNGVWCSDHYRFDVMVVDPKDPTKTVRPWLTSWQDVRSRKILGWRVFAGDPNTDTILAAFCDAAREFGLPVKTYVDNGKDYAGRAFHGITAKERKAAGRDWKAKLEADRPRIDGVYNLLQIEVMHAWPYHGQSKPIERFHNTLTDRFCRQQDTYCGKDPQHKPENLPDQIAKGKALTLQQFTEAFAGWLEADYHSRQHGGDAMDGRTPDQAFAANLHARRTTTNELLTFACMPRFGPVKCGQDGVVYKGLWFGGFDSQVQKLFGQQVLLAIDNADLSHVLILDTAGRLICQAKANRKLGWDVTAEDHGEAIRDKKQLRKRLREYNEALPRMAMATDTQALMERASARRQLAAAQDAGATVAPATIQAIQTGNEGQQDLIRSLIEREPTLKVVNGNDVADLADLTGSLTTGHSMRLVGGFGDDEEVGGGDLMRSLISRQESSDE